MKKLIGFITTFALLLSLTVTAFAMEYTSDWTVDYNGTKLTSTFDKTAVDKVLSGMLPGDSAEFTVTLKNSGSKKTDFWMSNEALTNFEESHNASGGAYTYELTYNGTALYSNDTVGGDNPNADDTAGLKEATEALKDYFYLGTLSPGQSGTVVLRIELDGQTLRNAYQEATAEINLSFAVEDQAEKIIKTGDRTNTLPYFIGLGAAGIVIIVLVIVYIRKNRKGGANV